MTYTKENSCLYNSPEFPEILQLFLHLIQLKMLRKNLFNNEKKG